MNALLKIILSLSLSGGLLILVFLLCKPLIKDKLSKRWQYYIWLIVVARLLLPFTPETNLMGTIFQYFDYAMIQTNTSIRTKPEHPTLPETDFSNQYTLSSQIDSENNKQLELNKLTTSSIFEILKQNITIICLLIWLFISIGLLIRKVTIYQSFVKYIMAGRIEISDMQLWEHVGKLVEQTGIKGTVELYTNSLISSPLLIGFFRVCIMLPTTKLSESDFENTILHELTHYKRRDMFYKWLVQVTICLHWFNPFVYLMGQEVNRTCELSCDEAIIKSLDAERRRSYGDTLLNAMGIGNYKDSLASITLNEGKKLLKERLDAIMKFKKNTRLTTVISIMLIFVLCFGATISGAYAATPSTNSNITSTPVKQSKNVTWDLGQVARWSISVKSENVIVKRGGSSFQIEVSPESKNSYLLEDYMHVITKKFQEREISLKRKKGLGADAIYSSTIIITVPNSRQDVLNGITTITTTSGNIRINTLHADKILAESKTGTITITNSFATDYIIAESTNGTVTLTNTTSDGYIHAEDKNTPEVDNTGNAHLSRSGYSKKEFAALLKIAKKYAVKVAKKNNLGTPQYAGELFDLDVIKGTISFNFDLDSDKYTTLAVDINSKGKVLKYNYWNSPE